MDLASALESSLVDEYFSEYATQGSGELSLSKDSTTCLNSSNFSSFVFFYLILFHEEFLDIPGSHLEFHAASFLRPFHQKGCVWLYFLIIPSIPTHYRTRVASAAVVVAESMTGRATDPLRVFAVGFIPIQIRVVFIAEITTPFNSHVRLS